MGILFFISEQYSYSLSPHAPGQKPSAVLSPLDISTNCGVPHQAFSFTLDIMHRIAHTAHLNSPTSRIHVNKCNIVIFK